MRGGALALLRQLVLDGEVKYYNKQKQQTQTLSQPQFLVDAFRKGLENSALTVRTTSSCQAGITHLISVQVQPDCPEYHALGQSQCFLVYQARLKDCANSSVLDIAISDKKWTGVDRHSSEQALRKAAENKKGVAIMQKELRNYFPILVLE